ncbi:hypothetical protein Dda_5072 [Drechslerella dactyloides]|uniref:Inhibitor of growth protein N-terminal histone-binding domain-containing protein n=1 Tax=Drechslerella dactyloides TaxID=74499 RepID=A0AAD6NIG5_DREDA|nr:hypothetical protein Dda_5072 [Drechslerella dactyloides]
MDVDLPSVLTSPDANPDARAVVSEYIDYTEYLHCDIARSLSLINKLDNDYGICAAAVHEVASDYCALVDGDAASETLPMDAATLERVKVLRQGIANPLNAGLADREESAAEAIRLYETVDRHFNRLSDIIRRLQKINVVPRQPLVQEKIQDKGNAKQSDSHMRITLRLDGQRRASVPSASARYANARASAISNKPQTSRSRATSRFTDEKPNHRFQTTATRTNDTKAGFSYLHNVQPTEPESSDDSDWDTIPNPPAFISETDRKSTLTHCFTEDGRRLPWFELQPTELAILRKRMKKNSSWQPSDAMMLKQLEMLGRGLRGFRKWARRTGQSKMDVDRILEGGDGLIGGLAIGALKRSQDNKGMRLNVMKRAKREREKAEAAAAAAAQTIENPVSTSATKFEAVGRSRAGGRRTSFQAVDAQALPKELSPTASAGQISRNKIDYVAKTSPYGDTTAIHEGELSQQPHNTRKLRKPLTGGGSGHGGEDGDDGDDMPIDPNEPTYCLCNRISFVPEGMVPYGMCGTDSGTPQNREMVLSSL